MSYKSLFIIPSLTKKHYQIMVGILNQKIGHLEY